MKRILNIACLLFLAGLPVQAQENAIYFDGTGDYIAIPDHPTLAVGSADFTLSFWITLSDINRVHDGLFGRNDYQWLAMEYNGDGDRRLNLWIDRTGTSGWELNNLKPAKNNWVTNQWYHIAVVREANTIKIYIDGSLAANAAFSGSIYNPAGVPLYFGRSQLAGRNHFGRIDDIRWWSYAQSEPDLQSSYRARLKGTEPGLAGYWDMNSAAGSVAYDRTLNNNHGTLYNDAVFTASTAPVNLNSADKPFAPVQPTGLPYNIIVTDLKINGNTAPANTQIGIFDDTLCVGSGIYTSGNLTITTWEKDAGQGYPGFTQGHPISFKIRTNWYTSIEIFNATAVYSDGDGDFGTGTYSAASLNASTILSPDILLSRTTVNFNAVQVGTPKTDTLTLHNTGNTNLFISNITAGLTNYTISFTQTLLAPGDTDTLLITFTPSAAIDYETTLTISSDDPDESPAIVTLNGTGLPAPEPQMVLSTSSILFSPTANGSSQTLSFNVLNIGDGTLNVTNITSSNSIFSVTSPVNFSLTQGQNRDINIQFAPITSGTHTTTITVYSNDGNSIVNATGISATTHFTPVSSTGLPYNLIIEDISVDTFLNVHPGEEVAVFDGTTCVGSTIINGGKMLNCNSANYAFAIPSIALPASYTLEAWLLFPLPVTTGGYRTLFFSAGNHHPVLINNSGELGIYNNGFIGSGFNVSSLPAGWHFVSASASGSTTKFYVDGIFKGTSSAKETLALTVLGNAGGLNQQSGFSDEYRVWNFARSAQQIIHDMNRKLQGTETGLLAYWNFNNNSVIDLAVGRTGVLQGGANITDGAALPDNINLIAWKKDGSLNGFTAGNPMNFKLWTRQYQQDLELNASPEYSVGNGTFGYGVYSVLTLNASTLLEPRIKLSTHRLYAGQVDVNMTHTDSFSIKNSGNANLLISLIESSVSFSVNRSNATLAPGDSVFVRVTFTPLSSGNHMADLVINSNDPDSAQLIIKLEGFAIPPGVPDIGLSTNSLDFGGIIKNNSLSVPFHVINTGTAALQVTSVTSNNPAFTVTPGSFNLANTNDNQGVYVTFQPPYRGLFTGTITITSNAGTRLINLRGVGYDGHFSAVAPTGLPYSIIITESNLASHINIGDEIAVFDGSLCVGSSAVLQDTGNIQVIAWKADPARSLTGFTYGNPVTFRIWSDINGFQTEFNASASFIVGNGTLGYGFYSVAELIFSLPHIQVSPSDFFVALKEPDSTTRILQIINTGDEDLITRQDILFTGGPEISGRKAAFDGNNDYISLGSYSPVQWTVEAWVKPSSIPGGRRSIIGGYNSCLDWGISMIDGKFGVVVRPYSGCSQAVTIPEPAIAGRWYHVAATNNGTWAKIYVDGNLRDSILVSPGYTGTPDMRIGGEACCAGNNFPGNIDEVRVWSIARTHQQILSTLYDTLTGTEPGLVAYYTFNNGTAEDLAGSRNGTLQNGTTLVSGNAPLYKWLQIKTSYHTIPAASSIYDTLFFNSSGLYEGFYTATLSVKNNTVDQPVVTVPVTLNVSGKAQIAFNQDSVDFGQVITGEKDTVKIILQNIGSKNLEINSILIPHSGTSRFSLLESLSFPIILTPVASQTLSVVFAPVSSGFRNDTLIIHSNDSSHLILRIPLKGSGQEPPDIDLSATAWSGTLPSGTVVIDTFYMRNTGQTPLTYQINETVPWLSVHPQSGSVPAHDSIAVQLNISAIGVYAGHYPATFTILSNDYNESSIQFSLSLSVTGKPELATSGPVNFGNVELNTPSLYSFRLTNTGTDTLHLDSVTVTDPVFILTNSISSIAPGVTDTINISFTPFTDILYSGILTIYSDAEINSVLAVNIQGRGIKPQEISVNPLSFDRSVNSGDLRTYTLTISNSGGRDLIYTLDKLNLTGQALYLDGNGDYINTVSTAQLNPDTALTLEAWIYLEDNTREYIFAKEMSAAGNYRLYINNSGYLQFTLNGTRSVISTTSIPLGQWVHVAATFNGTSMTVFINGLASNTLVSDGFRIAGNTDNLRIGRSFANEFFKGRIDEIRVWGVYHNETEIRSLMNQSLTGTERGLLLYYRFDETSGVTTEDLSVNQHTGTFYGNATLIESSVPVDNFLSLSVTSGIVPPFSSRNVTLTANAAGYFTRTFNQQLTLQSNDDDEPEILIPFTLHIGGANNASADSSQLIFKDMFFGFRDTVSFRLINTGASYLAVNGWNNSHTAFRVLDKPAEVLPFAEKMIRVEFAPTLAGLMTDTLRILTDDIGHPQIKIALRGLGVEPPEINFSDTAIDYGPVIVPSFIDTVIIVKNTGVSPLIVSSITSSSTAFTAIPAQFTLNSGDSTQIELRFSPADYLIYSALITLNTNIGPATIHVNGSGIRPGDDIGIIALVSPSTGCGLGDSLQVRVMIRNFGSSAQSGFNVGFKIDHLPVVIENTGSLSLPAGTTRYYSFTARADLSVTGSHIIKAFTLLPGDQANNNDTLILPVQNYPVLEMSVSSNRQICQGQTTTLSAAASQSTFIWSNGSVNSFINVSPAISTEYFVTATNINGCSDRDSIMVTVLALPPAPVITPHGLTTICSYDSLKITSSISPVAWSNGIKADSVYIKTGGAVYATYTDTNTCRSTSNIINVSIETVPSLQVNGFTTICKGDYTVLTIQNGYTYAWSTGETLRTINVAPLNTSTYYCTITTALSCRFTDSAVITVIDPVPPGAVGSMLPPHASTNVFKPIQFSWSPASNASNYDLYIWKQSESKPSVPTLSNINTINYLYQATGLEYGTTYKWMVVSKNSCHSTEGPEQSFTLRYLPDLITGDIQAPPTIYSGQPLTLTWEIMNAGQGSTNSQQWKDAAYLSLDSVLSSDDILLGLTDNLSYLVPAQTYSQTASYTLPGHLIGNYYVLIMADYYNSVDETNESNNAGAQPDAIITVTLQPRADLIVYSLGVPTNVFSGNTIPVNYQVKNTAAANAQGSDVQNFYIFGGNYSEHYWHDAIYISSQPTFSISNSLKLKDLYIGLRSAQNPNAGTWYTIPDYLPEDSSYSRLTSVTIPHYYYGTYYIYVLTDSYDKVTEDAENNNLLRSLPVDVILRPPADLVIDTVIAPLTAQTGQTVPVTYSVRNKGGNAPIETTWQDKIYVSVLDTFNLQQATLVSTQTITQGNELDADETYTRTVNIRLADGITGNFYVYVFSDAANQVFEYTYDTNNTGRSTNYIAVSLAPYPDLVIDTVRISDTAYAESSYPVTFTVRNAGTGIAMANWTDRIFISTSPTWNAGTAVQLASADRTSNLVSGGAYTKTVTITLPDYTEGTHYLYAFADYRDNVYEYIHESNNTQGYRFYIKDTTVNGGGTPGPLDSTTVDLALTAFSCPSSASSGSQISVSWTVINNGNRNTTSYWYDHIYLSTDSIFSANDILLDYHTRYGILYPGQSYPSSRTVLLPNGISGNYYLLLSIDHQMRNSTDTVRKNNTGKQFISITLTPPPDLVVQSFSVPATVIAGQQLRIPFTIRNAGTGATREETWQEVVYISSTPDLSGGYVQAGVYHRNSNLNAGLSYTDTVNITIPAYLSGFYYVIFRTDGYNKVYEHSYEGNNDKISFLQILVPDPSDLIVSNINMPATVNLGENVSITLTIKNTGTNAAIGNLSDAAYFSQDTLFNSTTDKLLKTYQGFVNIAPGDSITRTINNKMPGVVPGGYYGIGRTNLLNTVVESNINNNLSVSDDTLSVNVNELFLNVPDTFGLDQGDLVYYKVIVGSNLDLLITLTGNQANGSNEVYVAYERVPSVNDFDYLFDSPGEVNQRVLIPSTQSGTYYILVKTPTRYFGMQQAVILARALPFSILSIVKDTVGNGIVTTRIEGAGFKPSTRLYLLAQDSTVLDSAVLKSYQNSMQVLVQWDFRDDAVGTYHIKAFNHDTSYFIKLNGMVIEPSTGFLVDFNYVAPNMIRLNGKATFTFYYENIGNIDIPFIKGDYTVPTYTTLQAISTTGKVYKRSQWITDTSLGGLNDWIDYDNFRHIPTLAKNIAPGEMYSVTLMFRDFGNSAIFPLRVRSYGFSTEGFIRNQLNMTEGIRSHIHSDPASYSVEMNPHVLSLAADSLQWRDSILRFYFANGLLSPADTISFDLNCAECVSGYGAETEGEREFTYDPGLSPGIEKYIRTSFDAGEDYLWEINHSQGQMGKNPGWDLVEVTGSVDITATATNPFILRITSLDNEKEPGYLAGWYPAAEKCWPIAIAHEGIHGFAPNRFALDLSRFSPYNNLYAGTFRVTLPGTDTLWLCFSGDTSVKGISPSPEHPTAGLPEDNIPCGRMDDLGQTLCNDVFRTLHCDPACTGSFNAFVLEGQHELMGTEGVTHTVFGAVTTALGISNCRNSLPAGDYQSPESIQGVDLLGCIIASTTGSTSINCNGQFICTPVVRSCDPNDIIGPRGFGPGHYISVYEILPYTIRFENDSAFATTAAQKVRITQKLDNNIDPLSFRVKDFGFADFVFHVPYSTASYFNTLNLPDSLGYDLEVTAGIDVGKNEAFWNFQTIDPRTGLPPTNPLLGFLSLNDSSGNGEGFVSYTVKPKLSSLSGDTIHAKAEIIFDINQPIITPEIFNKVDKDKPVSYVNLLPAVTDTVIIPIDIEGVDEPKGSGLNYFKLYISENNSRFRYLGDFLPGNLIQLEGVADVNYKFFSIAVDNVGHVEPMKYFEEAVTVIKPDDIILTAQATDVSCYGNSDGSILLTVTGGQTPYTYRWSHGATSKNLYHLNSGVYYLTITDSRDSTMLDTFIIHEPAAVDVWLGNDTVLIPGTSVLLNATPAFDHYLWSDSSINSILLITEPGTYWIEVKRGNCRDRDSINISLVTVLTAVPAISHATCYGLTDASINLFVAGGTPPYRYYWSNGHTTHNISGLQAGSYTITITDAVDSLLTATYTITQPTKVDVSLGRDTFIILGTEIILNAGDSFNYYLWSDGTTLDTNHVSVPGTYWVEVGRGGCIDRDTLVISTTHLLIAAGLVTHAHCFNSADGIIDLIVNGGSTPYHYLWNTGDTVKTLYHLIAGTYSYTVTDAASSSFINSTTVLQPPPLGLNLGRDTFILAHTSVILNAGPIYDSYLWSDGSTLSTLMVDTTGLYSVTVTFNGCQDTDTMHVTTLLPFHLAVDTLYGCSGLPTLLDAGPGYDSYLWSNGNTTQTGTLTSQGMYSVTVIKASQQEQDSVRLILRPSPVVNLGADVSIRENESVTIQAPSGLSSYIWNDSSTLDHLIINGTTGLGVHPYSVTVTNLYHCTAADTVLVTVTPVGSISLLLSDAGIRIYPSPTTGILFFELNGFNQPVDLRITTVANQLLLHTVLNNSHSIDLTGLSEGIYLIVLQSGQDETVTKIIKY